MGGRLAFAWGPRRVGFPAALLLALTVGCAGTPQAPSMVGNVPLTEACSGEAGACLFGTATAVGFSLAPALTVNLYRVFPSGSVGLVQQQLVASQVVAVDRTWAFSGQEAWGHYYVQLVAAVQPNARAAPKQASTVIGPLAVPSGQPQALQVGP